MILPLKAELWVQSQNPILNLNTANNQKHQKVEQSMNVITMYINTPSNGRPFEFETQQTDWTE